MEGGQQSDKYIDNSGDKKYFTIIPNYIVNHSTAYEQSLYLVIKRFAGERGSCFASLSVLSEKMGVSKNTVRATIDKLLERKWIRFLGKKKNGHMGQATNEYEVVDLWELNIKFYQNKKGVSGPDTPSQKGVSGGESQVYQEMNAGIAGAEPKEEERRRFNEEEGPLKKISETERQQARLALGKVRKNLQEQGILSK